MDGQDWGEWAREWREDPGGKADRLVKQWEAESGERGESAGREFQVFLTSTIFLKGMGFWVGVQT